ncbi:unnamed protein product [Clonostachys chloroleuca]|uniref:Uncharacterized protein n=1 Tax=Clonostachys chloroleuca TaxID=1926264 RepID=A0AA35LTG4_9HYPO|nr:unnamed protein product [Clonostachys chloroleuca]
MCSWTRDGTTAQGSNGRHQARRPLWCTELTGLTGDSTSSSNTNTNASTIASGASPMLQRYLLDQSTGLSDRLIRQAHQPESQAAPPSSVPFDGLSRELDSLAKKT